jgi:hypothetical protein
MICVFLDLCTSNYMTTNTASWCVSWFYSVPGTEVKCHQILMKNVRAAIYHRSFLSLYSTLPVTSVKCHVDKHNLLWIVSVPTFCFALCFLYELCIQAVITYFPKQSLGNIHWRSIYSNFFSIKLFLPSMTQQPPIGPRPPHYRGFMITLRHTTLGRMPLDEWSARHIPLPDNTKHSQQTDIRVPGQYSNPQSQQASWRRPTP